MSFVPNKRSSSPALQIRTVTNDTEISRSGTFSSEQSPHSVVEHVKNFIREESRKWPAEAAATVEGSFASFQHPLAELAKLG